MPDGAWAPWVHQLCYRAKTFVFNDFSSNTGSSAPPVLSSARISKSSYLRSPHMARVHITYDPATDAGRAWPTVTSAAVFKIKLPAKWIESQSVLKVKS